MARREHERGLATYWSAASSLHVMVSDSPGVIAKNGAVIVNIAAVPLQVPKSSNTPSEVVYTAPPKSSVYATGEQPVHVHMQLSPLGLRVVLRMLPE